MAPTNTTVATSLHHGLESVALGIRSLQRLRGSRQVHAALMAAAGVELSQQEAQVLLAIEDGATVAQIARGARMDMGAVSRQLKSMEAEGILRRSASADNGSVVLVSLTPQGRRLAERVSSVRDTHLADALDSWTTAEVRTLGDLLQRLVEDLQTTPYPSASSRSTQ
jgi:DNA-binding MarR family transcriptional regulator